jgi:hypothetical protein
VIETFKRELGELAAITGEDLASKSDTYTRWVTDLGREPDDVIVEAFRLLRLPEYCPRGRFPSFYDAGRAFEAARRTVRTQKQQQMASRRPAPNQGAALSPGVLMCCVEYGRLNRGHLTEQQIEDDLTSLISARLTATEFRERIAASPGGKARALEEERERERREAVAARCREIDENTAREGEQEVL